MQKIKTIIVDDEPIARRGMQRLVETDSRLELVGVFPDATEAYDYISHNRVDLILLDIEMPGMNGMRFAQTMKEGPALVFTTAYTEYVSESYEVEAADYLVKPIDPDRFQRAITRLSLKIQEEEKETLTIKADRKFVRLPIGKIVYVEGVKDYIKIHLEDRKVITRLTIKGIEGMLPKDRFMRIHKSYIVNIGKITSFDSKSVEIGGKDVAIGQSFQAKVRESLLSLK